jgi:hypothetical protein
MKIKLAVGLAGAIGLAGSLIAAHAHGQNSFSTNQANTYGHRLSGNPDNSD